MSQGNVLRRLDAALRNSTQRLKLRDSVVLHFGSGASDDGNGDIQMRWDGTDFDILQLTANSAINLGVDGAGIDLKLFGDTASAYALWDQSADALILAGAAKLQVTGSGSIGYATGSGGAVTQITSASTGVTLNKTNGQITTVALTTAAGAEERFTVTNSTVAATDTIILGTTYDGAGTPMLSVQKIAAGAFDVVITNAHATNALNALMVINFAVIKAVAA